MLMTAHGLDADIPPGWFGRIYWPSVEDPLEESYPNMHIANFPLPEDDGDFGSAAAATMQPTGVFLAVLEYSPRLAGDGVFAAAIPRTLAPNEFSNNAMPHALPNISAVQKFFSTQGRAFCLYAVVGSDVRRPTLVTALNAVLATLRVERVRGNGPARTSTRQPSTRAAG